MDNDNKTTAEFIDEMAKLRQRINELERLFVENQQIETSLRRERDFNKSLFQTSPAFIVLLNAKGKIAMMNDTMLNALGYTFSEIEGSDYLTQFVPERDRPALAEIFKTLTTHRGTTVNENYVLTKDGKEILVEWHGNQIFNSNNEFDFFFGVGVDITDRKRAEEAQRRAELIETEKMTSLGRLVAGFAHELNTPIGVAIGSASALQHEARKINQLMTQEEVDVEELLTAVTNLEKGFNLTLSSLERTAHLVTSFKRAAVDQTSGETRTFRVLEVIEDTINLLRNPFKSTTIEIQVTCPSTLKVKSQPGALEQVLTNLLMNSLIHGFEQGRRTGHIHIVAHLQGTQLHLVYSDNGRGIAPENLSKIFEPFFTTHRGHGGSGLGMYICYNLVTTQLQGTISCDSTEGTGVKFRIAYPISLE